MPALCRSGRAYPIPMPRWPWLPLLLPTQAASRGLRAPRRNLETGSWSRCEKFPVACARKRSLLMDGYGTRYLEEPLQQPAWLCRSKCYQAIPIHKPNAAVRIRFPSCYSTVWHHFGVYVRFLGCRFTLVFRHFSCISWYSFSSLSLRFFSCPC